jgi:hypothetical protein
MADTVTVFLDTNIYLHYQMFDQINWLDVLQAKSVCIVVPPTTIRELNRVKDASPQPHLRRRAGKVQKLFLELFLKSDSGAVVLREGVKILFHPEEPLIDFAAHHLSRDVQDDLLMASIIAYREEHDGEEDVRLVTADAGVLMMGKSKRVRAISILGLSKSMSTRTPRRQALQTQSPAVGQQRTRRHPLTFDLTSFALRSTASPPAPDSTPAAAPKAYHP